MFLKCGTLLSCILPKRLQNLVNKHASHENQDGEDKEQRNDSKWIVVANVQNDIGHRPYALF